MAIQRDKVIASAEKLVAKGKIEAAIKEYERLLDDNPNDVNTLNRIGDLWVRINRNDEAVKTFTRIADHYSRDGFFLKAIAIYKKINKLDPSQLDIYAKLADLYAKQGLAMEAKSQYQVLADYYLKHGDPANALGIYRKISDLDPNSINVHVKLADLYSANNQTAEALKEYDRVGRMLLKRGMLDEAVQVFRKAVKIDSKNVELVESLVNALLEAKNYDNAVQIVEAALESNADNPRLLGVLGRVHLARGKVDDARHALERGLAGNPGDASIQETLANLYLREGQANRALEMLSPLAEKAIAQGERGKAVEMLQRVLRVDASHTPTLERLVGLYMRLNEETNILAAMNSLAEAHIAKGAYEEAVRVLERLIQREPQNAQHRNKLAFVKSQIGGTDTLPGKPKTAETPMPSMEVEEPPPTFDFGADAAPSFDIDLDSSPALELELSPPAPEPQAAPPPPPDRESAKAPPPREEEDDLDFITEHLTEAEVFAKYGLAEKAAEHLRAVIDRAPKNTAAYDRLFRLLLDEGETDQARTTAAALVDLLRSTGDDSAIDGVRNEFLSRGMSLGDVAGAAEPAVAGQEWGEIEAPALELEEPAPAAAEPQFAFGGAEAAEEISFDLDGGIEEFAEPAVEPEIAPEPEFVPEPEVVPEPEITFAEETAGEEFTLDMPAEEFSLDTVGEAIPEIDFGTAEPTAEPPAADAFAAEASEQPVDFGAGEPIEFAGEELGASGAEAFAEVEEPRAEPFFGEEAFGGDLMADEPSSDEVGEIDFYIGQELYDEARAKVGTLLALYPGSSSLEQRRDRLDALIAARAAPVAAPAPATLSPDEIEDELLSAIPDEDDFETVPAPPPPATPPPPPPAAALVHEDNLFADEDDFFDLAAELESELDEDQESISLSEEEQSLEEIFKEFKKGVEQQLDAEDYDTHYNLGIAYKEMGLIDEAIGEFQLASKDPKRSVECASMLGLCFLEKGMPQLAIKWYRKGLEIPEITEEEHVGLLYDLGSAYMEVGDTQNAQKAFMEVYGMNTNYRDIVSRIKQLEGAH